MPKDKSTFRDVPFVNFSAQYDEEREGILACMDQVFSKGIFIGSGEVDEFEKTIAAYVGCSDAVALNSGTDALILSLRLMGVGPGDEVITAPNTFIATASAIVASGAKPVFADVGADQIIDPAAIKATMTPKTRAIIPVHLTGRIADMDSIMEIADSYGVYVVEDAAQSIGSRYRGRMSGAIGHVGCSSAHPLKNLNAGGDAGFITTNDPQFAERLRLIRNHGLVDRNTVKEWGTVSRMDNIQAAILLMRLQKLDTIIKRRRMNAARYRELLAGVDDVFFPPCLDHEFNTFHTFVIQVSQRQELVAFLADRGVGTAIHYPVPIHLQPAAQSLGYKRGDFPVAERQAETILSLPIHQYLSIEDVEHVATSIVDFFH